MSNNGFYLNDKQMEVLTQHLQDENVDKELKLFLILELVYDGEISLTKAKELCTELGFFSEHWLNISERSYKIFREINEYKNA